ncbi:ParB N-terminal domain-containing protein [Photobacterium damselae]|uniref:ParB N-terminal domain-containing protein n=1 Tax=Photobacterium damselae TaxID=38293 RepID=UPI002543BFC5
MYRLELINIDLIKETEEHIPERVEWLTERIQQEGIWRVPVLLERSTYAIMDGHHRFNVAKHIGLKRIPAVLLDYDSPNVLVTSWRPDIEINKDIVIDYINKGKIFPHKTTRHIIKPSPQDIEIPLSFLF